MKLKCWKRFVNYIDYHYTVNLVINSIVEIVSSLKSTETVSTGKYFHLKNTFLLLDYSVCGFLAKRPFFANPD